MEKTRITLGIPRDFDPKTNLIDFLKNEDSEFKRIILENLKEIGLQNSYLDFPIILLDNLDSGVSYLKNEDSFCQILKFVFSIYGNQTLWFFLESPSPKE